MGYHSHMKTTIEISDNLLKRARQVSQRERTTLRSLVEEGLTQVLDGRSARRPPLLKPVTVKGHGLTPEYRGAGWSAVRDAIYAGHGA